VLQGIATAFFRPSCEKDFETALKEFLRVKYCFFVSSGTAALYVILKALSKDSSKKEIVIPAYTCPALVTAIVRAGLKVRLCDVSKEDLGFDLSSLRKIVSSQTLGIVFVHLLGIPHQWEPIHQLAQEEGIWLIEDAAQALGIESNGIPLGTRGDVGFFSFGRGKPLTLMSGGAIVTNSDSIAHHIEEILCKVKKTGFLSNFFQGVKLCFYSIFNHPHLYWIPNKLPFLNLGKTIFSPNLKIYRLNRIPSILGLLLLEKIASWNEERRARVQYLIKNLASSPWAKSLSFTGNNSSLPYLRFPLICPSKDLRNHLLSLMIRKGIGATGMYLSTLPQIEGIKNHLEEAGSYPNAEFIADKLLTLPIHPGVTLKDLNRILRIIQENMEKTQPRTFPPIDSDAILKRSLTLPQMIKKMVKFVLASLLFYTGFLRLYRLLQKRFEEKPDYIILMYHRVLESGLDYSLPGMVVSKKTFAKQMKYLVKKYKVIPLEELVEKLVKKENLAPRTCAITFDDGWRDNYQNAYPILRKYRLPATIFLTTNFIGTEEVFWPEMLTHSLLQIRQQKKDLGPLSSCPLKLYQYLCQFRDDESPSNLKLLSNIIGQFKHLDSKTRELILNELQNSSGKRPENRRYLLNWTEIQEMSQNGISFGAHSLTHAILTKENPEIAVKEMKDSKNIIEMKIGKPVKGFSYPNGDWNKELKEIAQKEGYSFACAVSDGTLNKGDLFSLRRMCIHETVSTDIRGEFSPALFEVRLARIF